MIDTDKYEGHTPAPWDSLVCATTGKKWIIDGPEETGQTIALVEGIGENDVGWINMWLMADAPLLLAEVKRLREWKAQVKRICGTMMHQGLLRRDTALFIMTNEVEEE